MTKGLSTKYQIINTSYQVSVTKYASTKGLTIDVKAKLTSYKLLVLVRKSLSTDKRLLAILRQGREMQESLFRKRSRAISTARLYVTIVHLQPINVVVYNDPQWKSNLGASFALRCFQRLSTPNAATEQCPWRNNSCTGGSSNTVLSY